MFSAQPPKLSTLTLLAMLAALAACGARDALEGQPDNDGGGSGPVGGGPGPGGGPGCTDFRVGQGPPHECGERVVGTGCRPCSEAANRALEECPDHNLECVRALAIDDADMEACSVCNASNTVACINRRADCDEVWAQAACCMEASCAGSHIYEAPTTANLYCWDFECASQIASWNECFDDELREACVEVAAAQCTR